MDINNDRHVPETGGQRTAAEVLANAIRVLTEAARLRRPVMERNDDGQWRAHPSQTEPSDWAEFVTLALAGAAANVGSIGAALAGRPGSWEADKVGDLLRSTVGHDEQYLFEHRTEPLRVVVDIEQVLTDLDIDRLYDDAEAALDEMYGDATAAFDYTPYYWTYTRTDDGRFVDDPAAPAWSIEAWRAGVAEEWLDELEQCVLDGTARGASIVKSPEADRAATQLAEREDAVSAEFKARFAALAAQRDREWATYAEAFAPIVRDEAGRRYPGIPVEIDLNPNPAAVGLDDVIGYGPEAQLIEHATLHTPLPGSGVPPKDYPTSTSIYATEKAAGRLPHLRLTSGNTD